MPQPQTAQLALHVFDGFLGFDRRVRAGLDGVLLRRQAERIIAQGVQHVFAEHAVEPGECVGGNVSERVAHVQAGTGREWEHVLHKQLIAGELNPGSKGADRVGGLERAVLPP